MSAQTAMTLPALTGWLLKLKTLTKTTPGILRLLQGVLLVCVALFALLGWLQYRSMVQTTQAIGKDAVPSIVAAEKVRTALALAHAQVLNSFVAQTKADSWGRYVNNMQAAHDDLLSAAQNITYGEEERAPILEMMTHLAEYERLVGESHARGTFGDSMRQADQLMKSVILPAATRLDRANYAHLDATYTQYKEEGSSQRLLVAFAAFVLLALLVLAQVYLFRATRRLVSPPLALATLVFILGLGAAAIQVGAAHHRMKVAKEDAFDSVHALWKARAVAADALTDESLYLLEAANPQLREKYAAAFQAKSAALLDVRPEELQTAIDQRVRLKGLLGDEWANITFPNEREAALSALLSWNAYRATDQRLRDVAAQRLRNIALSDAVSEAETAFNTFDNAVMATLTVNQIAFDYSVESSFKSIEKLLIFVVLSLIGVIVGSLLGFRARLNEYRF